MPCRHTSRYIRRQSLCLRALYVIRVADFAMPPSLLFSIIRSICHLIFDFIAAATLFLLMPLLPLRAAMPDLILTPPFSRSPRYLIDAFAAANVTPF